MMSQNTKDRDILETETVLLASGKRVEVQVEKKRADEEEEHLEDREMFERIRNVASCSSAAGSSFFHSYRRIKQIEEERLNKMEEDYLREKEKMEFNKQRQVRIMSYIESTNRKSEKRRKKKMKKVLKKKHN